MPRRRRNTSRTSPPCLPYASSRPGSLTSRGLRRTTKTRRAGDGRSLPQPANVGIASHPDAVIVTTKTDEFRADQFVNCAGLHSDRLARLAGLQPEVRIIPFRGEYYELKPEASYLVKGLIYPVPDPAFPFLGVHLTRMINGSVHAGPNAIFALAREGYTKLTINPRDVLDSLRWPGLWRLGSGSGVPDSRRRRDRCPEAFPCEPARTRPGTSG